MELTKIIDALDLKITSPYSESEKTVFLNAVIEDIKRFAGETDVYKFTATGLKMYPLPECISAECIKGVAVNGSDIPPAYGGEAGDSFYFLLPSGYIGFSSAPKAGAKIEILFGALCQIQEGDTDIALDREYLPLLITGAAADIAAAMEDISLSNNLRAEYNRLYGEGLQNHYRKRGCYPRTKVIKRREMTL
ncbi:MAG: hypothetical protein IJT38_05735 [Clostridia bacterium]|nr:hypothetical protein [Clostridia bacterium]